MILAFCNNTNVGTAVWDGDYTPVPVMGRDYSPNTEGFCEVGENPEFKMLNDDKANLIPLTGDIAGIENLGVNKTSLTALPEETIPTGYSIQAAYPNPFNPATTISFSVTVEEMQRDVSSRHNSAMYLHAFDINGRHVQTLINDNMNHGHNSIQWDASGIYFARLTVGDHQSQIKLQLIK